MTARTAATATARKGLNLRTINTLIDAKQPGLFAHRDGLALAISKHGTATWAFRYTAPDGRRRLATLQTVNDDISTADLRAVEARAVAMKRQVAAGFDPLAERDAQRAVVAPTPAEVETTAFEEAAKRFIAENAPHWRNPKHRAQWVATLERYAFPIIGKKAPSSITTQEVLDVLRQPYKGTTLWDGARETASRVRMRIETVLAAEYALNRDNPAQRDEWSNWRQPALWTGHLAAIFKSSAKRKKEHFAAMDWREVPAFVTQELQHKADFSARALLLTILCATRTSETLNATWEEFNLDNPDGPVWTIPAERMKAGTEHAIPLSPAAVKVLEELPRLEGSSFLFPGARSGRPLSNMSMLMLLRGMRSDESLTVHGFRSSFRDWAGEATLHPDVIVEMCLAHTQSDKTIAAYRRGSALSRRRTVVEQWADYLFLSISDYSEKLFRVIPH